MQQGLLPLSNPNRCMCHALPKRSSLKPPSVPSYQQAQQQQPQQQHAGVEQQQQQQQQEFRMTLSRPSRRYMQLWKTKRPRRKRRLLDAPTDPTDPLWGSTRRERKAALQQQLEEQYGPHAGDRDVRLYLKRRELNAARTRPSRRGGFPLDDSFEQPGTFLKLSADFQRTVLLERVHELSSTLPRVSTAAAWVLYTTLPGLLTLSTVEVAHRLTGLSAALDLSTEATLHYLLLQEEEEEEGPSSSCSCRHVAFLQPDAVRSRLGLVAKVGRLQHAAAVVLMRQHPALWLMSSRLLTPRVEQLCLLLHCCPVTSLKLIGSCPELLTAPMHTLQQQLTALCTVFEARGKPELVVPLLLWRPALLLQGQPAAQLDNSQAQQQQQQQHQEWASSSSNSSIAAGGQKGAGLVCVAMLQDLLHVLSTALCLPVVLVRDVVLRAPELLAMAAAAAAAGGSDSITAAVEALSSSWLMAPAAARGAATGQQQNSRQQYQQQLLQLLRPQEYSSSLKKRRLRQAGGGGEVAAGAGWYDAGQAVHASVLRCQWWWTADHQQQQQQEQEVGATAKLTAVQQLLLQAPALLVLLWQPQSLPAAAAAGQEVNDALLVRLQEMNQHVQALLDHEAAKQQQQQQPVSNPTTLGPTQQHQLVQQQQLQPQQQQQHHHHQQQQQQLISVLQRVVVLEPCVLTQPPPWFAAQLLQLSRALQVSADTMLSLVARHPAVLWLTQQQVFDQVRVLCGILRLPAQDTKHLLAATDADDDDADAPLLLLLMHPEAATRGFANAAASLAGGDESRLRRVLRQQPAALLPGNRKRKRVGRLAGGKSG